jgi:hypothetical protein
VRRPFYHRITGRRRCRDLPQGTIREAELSEGMLSTRALLLNNDEIKSRVGGEGHHCPTVGFKVLSSLPSLAARLYLYSLGKPQTS